MISIYKAFDDRKSGGWKYTQLAGNDLYADLNDTHQLLCYNILDQDPSMIQHSISKELKKNLENETDQSNSL